MLKSCQNTWPGSLRGFSKAATLEVPGSAINQSARAPSIHWCEAGLNRRTPSAISCFFTSLNNPVSLSFIGKFEFFPTASFFSSVYIRPLS